MIGKMSLEVTALRNQFRAQQMACLVSSYHRSGSGSTPLVMYTAQEYARDVSSLVELHMHGVREAEERRLVSKNDGRPVSLAVGICRVGLVVHRDGTVPDVRREGCSPKAIWRDELAAIHEVIPLPPPGREMHIWIMTVASEATLGVAGY